MDLGCCPFLFHCASSRRLRAGSDVLTALLFVLEDWRLAGQRQPRWKPCCKPLRRLKQTA